ncbi:unnamed protein product [Calicophoron daubneyi]|uniref:Transmembrane protein 18 n=1 Tax=Calicophoron daubneyi TaxID=300641 RepID=A0AAV2TYI5_CALDB
MAANFTEFIFNISSSVSPLKDILYSIKWSSEPWLVLVITFHLLLPALCLYFRKHPSLLALVLFSLLGSLGCASWLNELGAYYWRYFSTEQYFDSHGYFFIFIWCVPGLINSFIVMVLLLLQVGDLLVKKKRLELKATRSKKETKKRQ